MPTSEPWNPNPDPSLIDADGNMTVYCECDHDDPWCPGCDGTGAYKHPAPEYRPDKKIRCTMGASGAVIRWLAWDDKQIDAMRTDISDGYSRLVKIRGWDHQEIEVVPKHVGYFQRNDADGKF